MAAVVEDPVGAVSLDAGGSKNSSALKIWGSLDRLSRHIPACVYTPLQFFVAWHGVITIAYTGIPPALVQLKKEVDEQFRGIIPENPGSKWPKTTLGCLHDGKSLSTAQLQVLHQICSEESVALAATRRPISVDNLSVVLYQNCCLEDPILVTDIPLKLPADASAPSLEQQDSVARVMVEFTQSNLGNYYSCISKPGNRSGHYRGPKVGVTLVHFLATCPPALARLKERIDAALPGFYDWFADSTLHITIRAIL